MVFAFAGDSTMTRFLAIDECACLPYKKQPNLNMMRSSGAQPEAAGLAVKGGGVNYSTQTFRKFFPGSFRTKPVISRSNKTAIISDAEQPGRLSISRSSGTGESGARAAKTARCTIFIGSVE